MSGTSLECTNCEKDLGVMVTVNLNFNKQHGTLINKASQKLGLLRRSCSFSKSIAHRKMLYLAIVRSQFEHCSQVWRPVKPTQSNKFEALQKRGIKWIFGEDFSFYSKKEYYDKLKQLDILPLSLKFDLNDLTFFHKIFYRPSDFINIPHYLIINDASESSQGLRRQTRSMTSSDNLQLKCTVHPRVNAFVDSFYYRTYLKWNKLPFNLREIDNSDSFKIKLKDHLWTLANEMYCND